MTVNISETRWWRMWPTMLLGALLGLMLVPVGDWAVHVMRDAYDTEHPVVVSHGTLVERDVGSITVVISGEKKRDCAFLAIAGYTMGTDGLLRSTYMTRVDQPATGATRPIGKQTFGRWKIWPTEDSISVEVWFSHQCEGRLVRSKAAEISLLAPQA